MRDGTVCSFELVCLSASVILGHEGEGLLCVCVAGWVRASSSKSAELISSSKDDDGEILFSELIDPFLDDSCGTSFAIPLMATTEKKKTAVQDTILVATRKVKSKSIV